MTKATATKHACEPEDRAFGRRAAGCPRCTELANGAPARAGWQREYYARQRQVAAQEARRSDEIRRHYDRNGQCACGPVCTAFEW